MAPRPRFLSFASSVPAAAGDGHEKPSPMLPMPSLPVTARNNVAAVLGEFVGTFLFLFFAFAGTQIATDPSSASKSLTTLIFIALAFGVSLTTNVWAFYRMTGGLFNPAVHSCSSSQVIQLTGKGRAGPVYQDISHR
jgi:hypothetical protein